jgi:MaoC dehydratase-like protein
VAKAIITDDMRKAIGSELGRSVAFPITDSDIRRWAVAVYYPEYPPRQYWDAEHAARIVHGCIVAPEEFNPFAWMSTEGPQPPPGGGGDPDSLEHSLGIEGPHLNFRLNGGMEVEYGVRMRPGDVITSVRRLSEYREREGRLGLMLFTTFEEVWTNQNGDLVKNSRFTLIRY